jgi:GNAT superfamily N-acetyltransferase
VGNGRATNNVALPFPLAPPAARRSLPPDGRRAPPDHIRDRPRDLRARGGGRPASIVAPNAVSIAEGHQRRGIGRRAMQQVLEHWRQLGVTAARTSVVPSNTGATRLYESLGFRLTGEEDDGELVMTLDM